MGRPLTTDKYISSLARYHNHGDTIAVQYGGSHLVNTMETYRKINQWTSQSRDMVESFKRYYNNSFVDRQRQEAYNLFLGNYIFAQGQPMLWDLSTDYYLHHADPRLWSANKKKSYTRWFGPASLHKQVLEPCRMLLSQPSTDAVDDYWIEYYRPSAISSFPKMYSFRMKSTLRFVPATSEFRDPSDLSPFHVRVTLERDNATQTRRKKGVKIAECPDPLGSRDAFETYPTTIHVSAPFSQNAGVQHDRQRPGILKELLLENQTALSTTQTTPNTAYLKDKSAATQIAFNQFIVNSLSPIVSANELSEYGRYISHPLNFPLVMAANDVTSTDNEFQAYVQGPSVSSVSDWDLQGGSLVYEEYLRTEEDPLKVGEDDTPKKRYKAYKQWLKGKSLFKQPRTDG